MAEYGYALQQTVAGSGNVLLQDIIRCNKGYVYHRSGSGILTLKGIVNNSCQRFARYKLAFNGNIAVPEGGTAGPISLAIAISGEPLATSQAIVTPTVAEAYFNVTSVAIIDVPVGCCLEVAIENTSTNDAGTPVSVNVQNANLTVDRVA